MPSDVRKVSDLPQHTFFGLGLRPYDSQMGGRSPFSLPPSRKVIDLPHIRRHSRKESRLLSSIHSLSRVDIYVFQHHVPIERQHVHQCAGQVSDMNETFA